MRIEGPARLRNATGPKRAARSGGGQFSIDGPAPGRAAGTAGSAQAVGNVTALLALQELPDAVDGRSRGVRRGHDLLDMLDQVRHALLLGHIQPSRLQRLLRLVRDRAAAPADPVLREILQDIELRAAVELAKFEQVA